jgi:hypothetical protein
MEWNFIRQWCQYSSLGINFDISSIYNRAISADYIDHPLGEREIQLFNQLETTNFEQILSLWRLQELSTKY